MAVYGREAPAEVGGVWDEAIGAIRAGVFGGVAHESAGLAHEASRCQATHRRRRSGASRPCSRPPTTRVTGTQRRTIDLCSQHARMAVDRPRLVTEWLEDPRRRIPGPRAVPGLPLPSAADVVVTATAEPGALAVIREAVARALTRYGWSDDLHPVVLLAVSEAVANAIEHGSAATAEICVTVRAEPGRVHIRVADGGRLGSVMPLEAPEMPATSQVRGRGLVLMRTLSQGMSIRSGGDGTVVSLEFTLPDAARWDGADPGDVS